MSWRRDSLRRIWEPFPPLSLHPAMFATSLHHVQHLREIGRRAARGLEAGASKPYAEKRSSDTNWIPIWMNSMWSLRWCLRFANGVQGSQDWGRYTRRAEGGHGEEGGWKPILSERVVIKRHSTWQLSAECRGDTSTTVAHTAAGHVTTWKHRHNIWHQSCVIDSSLLSSSTRKRLSTQNNWQKHIFIIKTHRNLTKSGDFLLGLRSQSVAIVI